MAVGALLVSLGAALGGCASSGAVPRPFPETRGRDAAEPPSGPPFVDLPRPAAPVGYAVAGTALGLRGVPYRNGGNDPRGFDCSGFVWFVFAQHGIDVPRTVTDLFESGQAVSVDDLQPGDLIFFSTVAPGASHVAMSIGGDQFVHAPSSQGEVRTERLSAPYWRTRIVGARRLIRIADRSGAALRPPDARPSGSAAVSWTL
jgi:hypothetical protein